MRVVKQEQSLSVINLDQWVGDGFKARSRHSKLLPDTIRALICGPSNCGKSNVMLSMLFKDNGLRFENIYVYSKSLYQPKYMLLEKLMSNIPEAGYFTYKENDEIIDPADARPQSIFIFDDVACDNQEKIREYFSMGRHSQVDSFYLCQTYSRIPKHLIRDNANLILLFKQDDLNLRHVYEDHVSADMKFDQFKEMCRMCWDDRYSFITIDKDSDMDDGRYRKGLDQYILIETDSLR